MGDVTSKSAIFKRTFKWFLQVDRYNNKIKDTMWEVVIIESWREEDRVTVMSVSVGTVMIAYLPIVYDSDMKLQSLFPGGSEGTVPNVTFILLISTSSSCSCGATVIVEGVCSCDYNGRSIGVVNRVTLQHSTMILEVHFLSSVDWNGWSYCTSVREWCVCVCGCTWEREWSGWRQYSIQIYTIWVMW